jgi:hypothetical protein
VPVKVLIQHSLRDDELAVIVEHEAPDDQHSRQKPEEGLQVPHQSTRREHEADK